MSHRSLLGDGFGAVAALSAPSWLVGGALRDRLLLRPSTDYDVVTAGDTREVARAIGQAAGGHAFQLSEVFGVWRVVPHERLWQVDVLPLAGESIETDLARRDFTVNAIAERLTGATAERLAGAMAEESSGELVDPFGGLHDLKERRLRMISEASLADDPLRTMRLARLSCELGFKVDPATARAATSHASGLSRVAPERTFEELKRIVSSERALDGLALMDDLAVTDVVLPELGALRGVQQSGYHHLDVHHHTRAVLAEVISLERDPAPALGDQAGAVQALLSQPLANELTRWQALRFGALLHDIAKPQTRAVTTEGRITFIGHDQTGAEVAASLLRRLRASERLVEYVAAMARHHLRLGFLVHEMPLDRRAIYRYLSGCAPVQVDITVLSVADRLATRGRGSGEAIEKHLRLARQLLGEALNWLANPPRAPVRGDELSVALGLAPGPELGRLLAELEEARFAGEVANREDAIAWARELVGR